MGEGNDIFLTLSRFANTGMYDRELTATAKAALLVFAWRGSVDWMKDRVTCKMGISLEIGNVCQS